MKPCSFTGVGSLPHISPKKAVSHVFQHYEIPFLPQLPNRHPQELMIYQWLSSGSFYGALSDFLKRVDSKKIFKVQLAGPLTIAKSGVGNFYPDFIQFYRDQLIEFLRRFEVKNKMWVVFDEPFLDESSAEQLFNDLDRIVSGIERKTTKFLFGIHSCNQWTPLLFSRFFKTRLHLVSFDAELGADALFQDRSKLFSYLKRGLLLWGIVPTRKKAYEKINDDYFLRYLQTKNLQKKEILNILSRSHFTPACGTATLKLEDEQNIARKLLGISAAARDYYERGLTGGRHNCKSQPLPSGRGSSRST